MYFRSGKGIAISKILKEENMKYFEDFQVGDTEVTRARTITETDIVNFAAFSGDWYPLHTDIEYAKKGPFGERIAHGMLVLSVANGLMPLYDMAIIAFYGMDKVRFTAPTRIGDTIHVELEVIDKKDKGDLGGVVSLKESVKNQRGEDVAVSTMKVFIANKPG
jgi:3-hydroxybutyryl-CoA dehydratase